MAMVVYPTESYDSFITVAEADTTILKYTLNTASWEALSDSNKEAYLRIAFSVIVDGLEDIPDDPVSDCLKGSQALNAVHDLLNGVSNPLSIESAVKKEEAGQVKVEYFEPASAKVSDSYIHPLSIKCLSDLEYNFPLSGFGQTTLGRS